MQIHALAQAYLQMTLFDLLNGNAVTDQIWQDFRIKFIWSLSHFSLAFDRTTGKQIEQLR